MSNITEIWTKICRRWKKIRLQPIRVFCFHHVSAEYDPLTMWECDWMQLEKFKHAIIRMRGDGVRFISLPEAHEKLQHDTIRRKKYAVLTADDGYKSLLNILPWLEEQQIPITLFVNTKYLDGKSWSAINEEQARRANPDVDMEKDVCPNLYMTKEELLQVIAMPNVTIGMHGHEHLDATTLTIEEFKDNVMKCRSAFKDVPQFIPYFAYTWGRHKAENDGMLKDMGLIPMLVNGTNNYTYEGYIDRLSIDGNKL